MPELYDSIGTTYTATRTAEPRIAQRLVELLKVPIGASILDVGAGTGNYSAALAEVGYNVTALEPSKVMRDQRADHPRLRWCEGFAEELPFEDDAFDGVMMTLCMHHFSDWHRALEEASRVVGSGPIVILTFDAELDSRFWLFDYFPSFRTVDKEWFPKLEDIDDFAERELQSSLAIHRFALPPDLIDHFAAAGWGRPEIYLQESYRAGISSFAKAPEAEIRAGLEALESDLQSGRWDSKHGSLRSAASIDVGYVFLVIHRIP